MNKKMFFTWLVLGLLGCAIAVLHEFPLKYILAEGCDFSGPELGLCRSIQWFNLVIDLILWIVVTGVLSFFISRFLGRKESKREGIVG